MNHDPLNLHARHRFPILIDDADEETVVRLTEVIGKADQVDHRRDHADVGEKTDSGNGDADKEERNAGKKPPLFNATTAYHDRQSISVTPHARPHARRLKVLARPRREDTRLTTTEQQHRRRQHETDQRKTRLMKSSAFMSRVYKNLGSNHSWQGFRPVVPFIPVSEACASRKQTVPSVRNKATSK